MRRALALAIVALSACSTTHQDLGRDLTSTGTLVATRIAAGHQHTCAIDTAGRLYCWGLGHDGRLGIDPRDALDDCGGLECDGSPRPSPTLTGVMDVAVGETHTCALLTDGRVRCFGADVLGQLARGSADGEPHPTPVTVELDQVHDLAAGEFHTCITRWDGSVWCWGLGQRGQLGVDPSTLERCIADGSVFYQLEVADGDPVPCATRPVQVPGITDAEEIAAGAFHTCVTRSGGGVACWGAGSEGQLGHGDTPMAQITPVDVMGVSDISDIASGLWHTCAKDSMGGVACWGAHYWGQLGIGTEGWTLCGVDMRPCSPVAVDVDMPEVHALALGRVHTCGVTHSGDMYCFGDATGGRLGLGAIDESCDGPWGGPHACRTLPTLVTGGIAELASGGAHTCVIRTGGVVACTGSNDVGQSGAPPGGMLLELTDIADPIEYR